ncbi:MAG: hypothetical protein IPL93_09040 [Actinomycetales bacterium]|jgi:hypothetical protein|nr:hypothetical protein [Actinomycetales bacterium]
MTSDPAARHTGQQPPPSWWRRNRVALVALLPMLALALAASSFRYVSIYRPTTFVAGQVATGSTGRFLAPVPGAEPPTTRDVSITLVSATPHASSGDLSAAKGTRLWEVELEFAADPGVPLTGCTIELLDVAGQVYGTAGGKPVPATGRDRTAYPGCVPDATPGPELDLDGRVIPATGRQRPASWPVLAVIAIPTSGTPVAVRIHWGPPDYAQLPLP